MWSKRIFQDGQKDLWGYEVVCTTENIDCQQVVHRYSQHAKQRRYIKKHYESYPWFDEELLIEETEYDGVPLSESKMYNRKEIVDKEHYFDLMHMKLVSISQRI